MDDTAPHDDDIPPRLPVDQWPPLRTQADLHHHWRGLMGPLGFTFRRLWLLFLEPDDRVVPHITEIDDIPEEPRAEDVDSLMAMCAHVQQADRIGRVAILLSRPGRGALCASDRRWGRALLASARRTGVRLAPLHLANDEVLVPLTGDDLIGSGSTGR
jgi:hypothetical protein